MADIRETLAAQSETLAAQSETLAAQSENLKHVLNLFNKKIDVCASQLSSNQKKNHFKYLIVGPDSIKLDTYQDQTKNHIKSILTDYTTQINEFKRKNQKEEVQFVQPLSKDLLTRLSMLLKCKESVHVMNEKEYRIEVEDMRITGKTDHAICWFDIGLCTLEDKRISEPLESHIDQVLTQMRAEIFNLSSLPLPYVPKEFTGIFQNGLEWLFIKYFSQRGNKPALCYNPDSIDTIVDFLEDTLVKVDEMLLELRSSRVPIEVKMPSIGENDYEDNSDDERDKDDGYEKEQNPWNMNPLASSLSVVT